MLWADRNNNNSGRQAWVFHDIFIFREKLVYLNFAHWQARLQFHYLFEMMFSQLSIQMLEQKYVHFGADSCSACLVCFVGWLCCSSAPVDNIKCTFGVMFTHTPRSYVLAWSIAFLNPPKLGVFEELKGVRLKQSRPVASFWVHTCSWRHGRSCLQIFLCPFFIFIWPLNRHKTLWDVAGHN